MRTVQAVDKTHTHADRRRGWREGSVRKYMIVSTNKGKRPINNCTEKLYLKAILTFGMGFERKLSIKGNARNTRQMIGSWFWRNIWHHWCLGDTFLTYTIAAIMSVYHEGKPDGCQTVKFDHRMWTSWDWLSFDMILCVRRASVIAMRKFNGDTVDGVRF